MGRGCQVSPTAYACCLTRRQRCGGLAAGTAFTLEGKSALNWIESPSNDLSVPVFFDNWERAVRLASPRERESALVRALLALVG